MDGLDAAALLDVWHHFDADGNGWMDATQQQPFLRLLMNRLGPKKEEEPEQEMANLRERLKAAFEASVDGRLHIGEVSARILNDQEDFLLMFRRETPLHNSVEFMRIWRNYDTDGSGFISTKHLKNFLHDVFLQDRKSVRPERMEWYTDRMVKLFDKNRDGRLDLNHLARILALKENFLLKFRTDASSQADRRRDFEKIFAHYDVSQTGALEGPEVDGFVKDMMELVKPSLSGADLEHFKKALLGHCDINRDGKIQKNELALCLGLKLC